MRYGIFSDIHSNAEALEAVVAALRTEHLDRVLCCGDLVGYAADPEVCVQAVRATAHAVVAGNHDWAVAGKMTTEWFHPQAAAAIRWTASHLSPEACAYLAELPLTWSDGQVSMAHGTLHHPDQFDYLLDEARAAQSFMVQATPVAFVGHTHVPLIYTCDAAGDIRLIRERAITVTSGVRYLVNVGSVGQPRDHNPQAAYGVYDTETHRLELRRVPYAVARTREKIQAAALPAWCADRLLQGI